MARGNAVTLIPVHAELTTWELEAQHPDEFIANLISLALDQVATAAEECRFRLRNPSKSAEEYINILAQQPLLDSTTLLGRIRRDCSGLLD